MSRNCFLITLGFFIPMILLYKLYYLPYILNIFVGVFLIAYQLPGLLYCKKRLLNKLTDEVMGLSALSKRENEVAMEIYRGLKYEAIAEKLFISLSAVKKHAYNIYQKLGIHNNRELIMIMTNDSQITKVEK